MWLICASLALASHPLYPVADVTPLAKHPNGRQWVRQSNPANVTVPGGSGTEAIYFVVDEVVVNVEQHGPSSTFRIEERKKKPEHVKLLNSFRTWPEGIDLRGEPFKYPSQNSLWFGLRVTCELPGEANRVPRVVYVSDALGWDSTANLTGFGVFDGCAMDAVKAVDLIWWGHMWKDHPRKEKRKSLRDRLKRELQRWKDDAERIKTELDRIRKDCRATFGDDCEKIIGQILAAGG